MVDTDMNIKEVDHIQKHIETRLKDKYGPRTHIIIKTEPFPFPLSPFNF